MKYCTGFLYLALKISGVTATSTAILLDARYTLDNKVADAHEALETYYIDECTKFMVMEDRSVSIYYHTSTIPEVSGIYFLIHEGEILYIGRSGNIYNRVNNHAAVREYYFKNSKPGYNIVCGIHETADNLVELEKKLINVAQPKANVKSKYL